MIVGEVEKGVGVPCRVHDQCVTSEVFGSLRCDCKQQLNYALQFMQDRHVQTEWNPTQGFRFSSKFAAALYTESFA